MAQACGRDSDTVVRILGLVVGLGMFSACTKDQAVTFADQPTLPQSEKPNPPPPVDPIGPKENLCDGPGNKLVRSDRTGFDFLRPGNANELRVMQYNVENLFDTIHDQGKQDFEFLPMTDPAKSECEKMPEGTNKKLCQTTDWTDSRLQLKLSQIARAVGSQGELPDLLSSTEIENKNVAGMMAARLGYGTNFEITDGPDERGIDVALFYRTEKLRKISSREIQIGDSFSKDDKTLRPTRPILAVYFEVLSASQSKGSVLAVYVNHWPSQGNPTNRRLDASLALQTAIDEDYAQYGETLRVLSMGDFNTIPNDYPHPFLSMLQVPTWSHYLMNVQSVFERNVLNANSKLKNTLPKGSYFFSAEMAWNQLDVFFVSPSLLSGAGLRVKLDSFRIVAPEFLTTFFVDSNKGSHTFGSRVYGVPKRYDHNADTADKAGFSDHFPIQMVLNID